MFDALRMKQRPFRDTYARYISMDDYTQEIYADV